MSNSTHSGKPLGDTREPRAPKDDETAPRGTEKQPSDTPSFAGTDDEPLATAGTGGSHDPKGRVRPGGGQVPADSDEFDRRAERLEKADADAKQRPRDPKPPGAGIPPLPEPDVEGVGKETGPSADKTDVKPS